MGKLDELARYRRTVVALCRRHYESVMQFRADRDLFDCGSFYLHVGEPLEKLTPHRLLHLTCSATCIESLNLCPETMRPRDGEEEIRELEGSFSTAALARPSEEWVAEGSGQIYSRCRGLPLALKHMNRVNLKAVGVHLKAVFEQLYKVPARFGLGETNQRPDVKEWYPPNAFHTYWTLECLRVLEQGPKEYYDALTQMIDYERWAPGMQLWLRQTLAAQTALHASDSSERDTDQLMWSLAAYLRLLDRSSYAHARATQSTPRSSA